MRTPTLSLPLNLAVVVLFLGMPGCTVPPTPDVVAKIQPYPSAAASAPELYDRGLTNQIRGNLDAAISEYDQALMLNPSYTKAYIARGQAREAKQDLNGAIADYGRAIELDPHNADAFRLRGITNDLRGDRDHAIADLLRAVALRPTDAFAYACLSYEHFQKGDYPTAIADASHALEIAPNYVLALRYRGNAKHFSEDHRGAIVDFDRAIAIDPNSALTYFRRAKAKTALLDYDGAISDYDRAFALDPDVAPDRRSRALIRQAKGDLTGALADYQDSIKRSSAGPDYSRFFRHLVLRQLGRGHEDDLRQQVSGWKSGWPATVGLFLTGQITGEEFSRRAAEGDNAQTRREHLCEERYYSGMIDLLEWHPAAARKKFSECLATGLKSFKEFILAQAELARLGSHGTVVSPTR
jgi:tetratricopeptide (TPR) repeat protein